MRYMTDILIYEKHFSVNKEDSLPEISLISTEITVKLGQQLVIPCDVKGTPNPSVYWTKTGSNKIISDGDHLNFNSILHTDEGEYHCNAKNRKGKSRVSVIIEVIGKNIFSLLSAH